MDVCIEGCVVVCVYTRTTCVSVCAVLHYSAFRDSCPKTFFFPTTLRLLEIILTAKQLNVNLIAQKCFVIA